MLNFMLNIARKKGTFTAIKGNGGRKESLKTTQPRHGHGSKNSQKNAVFSKKQRKYAKITRFSHKRNSCQAKKRPEPKLISSGLLAGVAGFEPTNDGVRGCIKTQ